MKEIQHKKILKEAGVLLLAAVMILATVAVAANKHSESPEFMVAGADDSSPSQQTNTHEWSGGTTSLHSGNIKRFDTPTSSVNPLPPWKKTMPFTVTATASAGSGVKNVTLYYRYSSNGAVWTEWASYGVDTQAPWSWSFTGSDGYYQFYSIAVDNDGHVEDPPSTADASTGIDTTKPVTTLTLNGTMGVNNWYVSDVLVTLLATDNLSGIASIWYIVDTGVWKMYSNPFTVSSEGNHTVFYRSLDRATNVGDTLSVDFRIDKTAPTTTHTFNGIMGKEGWYVSNVTVTLTAEDEASGVNYTMYKVDDGEWVTYAASFLVTEDGVHNLSYYSVDYVGHIEHTNEVELKIVHDTMPPTTTHTFNGIMGEDGWYVSNVTVTLTAEDEASGVNYTMYKVDDGEWVTYAASFLVTEDGVHNLRYYSVDYMGNEEDVKGPFDFKIDRTAPEINLTVEKTGLMKWLLTVNVSDETSGVDKVEFYLDGEYLGEVTEPPFEWVCSKKGTAQAIVYDNAGNEAISDPVPVSQSQNSGLDVGRVWLRGLLFRCNRVGDVYYAFALRLHYIEFTPTERTGGMVIMKHMVFTDSARTGRMYEFGAGLFTYVFGFFEGGLEIR
jgi:uncharacterized lipoprotein NlpE involved in copper resistance